MTVPNQFLHKHQGSGARLCEVPRIGQVGGEPRREAGVDGQEHACVRDRLEPRLHVGDGGSIAASDGRRQAMSVSRRSGAPAWMKLITTCPPELYDIPALGLRIPPGASRARQSYYD